jgi:cytochrome b561
VATGDDWLAVHVTAQLALITVVALHVGLVLKHTVVQRNAHLTRML